MQTPSEEQEAFRTELRAWSDEGRVRQARLDGYAQQQADRTQARMNLRRKGIPVNKETTDREIEKHGPRRPRDIDAEANAQEPTFEPFPPIDIAPHADSIYCTYCSDYGHTMQECQRHADRLW